MTFSFVSVVSAAAPNWDISGDWMIDFAGGTQNREFVDLTQDADGNVSGAFLWLNGSTWELGGTLNGSVSGDDLILNYDRHPILYTGVFEGTINTTGMSGTFEASSGFTGDWSTTGSPVFLRRAGIEKPDVNERVWGNVDFNAFLIDDDEDSVQWAVREGTCAMATSNVIGNVDGMSHYFDWITTGYTQAFKATHDVSGWDEGMYCFVFNPKEDGGENDIRLTREFYVDNPDDDGDGVLDDDDLCPDTKADEYTVGLGTNRWMWNENGWITNSPANKNGNAYGANPGFTLTDTYGCSCIQILDSMRESVGEDFEGHYKYMCSKSIIEDWIAGEYYVGPTFVETVEVPANKSTVTLSGNPLVSGVKYFLTARGTADAGDGIEFDARYSFRTPTSSVWTDSVSTYESHGPILLDLLFNGSTPWGDYNPAHEYDHETVGAGTLAEFKIHDIYYPNNTGSLFVDVVEDKWVDLW